MSSFRTQTYKTSMRRGNTLILVAAILVLLTIIATAFVSRTQVERATSVAVQQSNIRSDANKTLAGELADMIAGHLFTRPIDANDPEVIDGRPAQSNFATLPPMEDAIQFDSDKRIFNGLSLRYNSAPYHTVPWTNWPDSATIINNNLYPGNPFSAYVAPFDDLPGNPGFGDTRWLRDLEPQRMIAGPVAGFDGIPESGDEMHFFTHWLHMTNISRADNGFRIVRDISDVTNLNASLTNGLVTDLNFPVEQFLPIRWNDNNNVYQGVPGLFSLTTGTVRLIGAGGGQFYNEWQNWFDNYPLLYHGNGATSVPSNFIRLSDLDGDGVRHNYTIAGVTQDRPQDEFIPGRLRHMVSRILADADGDGMTDSFWYLAPISNDRGLKTLIAVSIIDNNSMMNVNVGTTSVTFDPANYDPLDFNNNAVRSTRTRGAGPQDLALISWDLNAAGNATTANLGFYDGAVRKSMPWGGLYEFQADQGDMVNPDRVPKLGYLLGNWATHCTEVGLLATTTTPATMPNHFGRLDYWLRGGSCGLDPALPAAPVGTITNPLQFHLTPFGLDDEIELRAYFGNNNPWTLSRLEYTMEGPDITSGYSISPTLLRAWQDREESSEYRDQLSVRDLAQDYRHRITTYNGARNDLLPPWLRWPEDQPIPPGVLSNPAPNAVTNFINQSRRKLDLREPTVPDLNFLGLLKPGELTFAERLPYALMFALSDGTDSYFGPLATLPDGKALQKLAAAFSANILARSDLDYFSPLVVSTNTSDPVYFRSHGAVPLPAYLDEPEDLDTRMLGMERQPFLLEAFIAHVHEGEEIPLGLIGPGDTLGHSYVDDGHPQSTVVVVQIVNPFDGVPVADINSDNVIDERDLDIDLWQYSIRVFGRTLHLQEVVSSDDRWLRPGTEAHPRTAIFYSIESSPGGTGTTGEFRNRWLDFLDLNVRNGGPARNLYYNPADTVNDRTILVDVTAPPGYSGTARWAVTRGQYDCWQSSLPLERHERAIELLRRDPVDATQFVVVDRFSPNSEVASTAASYDDFRDAVRRLYQPPARAVMPGPPPTVAGVRIGLNNTFVTWARVTRAWGDDFNYDSSDPDFTAGIQPSERNPRFVFARQEVTRSHRNFTAVGSPSPFISCTPWGIEGDAFDSSTDPDSPWFSETFNFDPLGTDPPRERKPTFFTMNPVRVGNTEIYPDFYAAGTPYGRYFYDTLYPANAAPGFGIPDKGFYARGPQPLTFSLQMLQKDADYEQVGELLNTWLYGHELTFSGGTYAGTRQTFAEAMRIRVLAGERENVNRLHPGPLLGNTYFDVPNLPGGVRLLDMFVCDGPGRHVRDFAAPIGTPTNPNITIEDYLHPETQRRRFNNAAGFTGKRTPGMPNINTAPVEVLRAAPHMYTLSHATRIDGFYRSAPGVQLPLYPSLPATGPRVRLAEHILQYRDSLDQTEAETRPRYDVFFGAPLNQLIPSRGDSLGIFSLRSERGIVSVGEISLMNKLPVWEDTTNQFNQRTYRASWAANYAGNNPFQVTNPIGTATTLQNARFDADVSTDLDKHIERLTTGGFRHVPDDVAGDAEERNLLFAGISNMVTTRSDVFTVYLRVRTFRQNPTTGVWDATDPNQIVDDTRFVMLVDRSEVNSPSDKPKILFFEKFTK